ncbi:MAG: hypothetical protein J6X55_17360 [Victivallales bacterium]|nr:hypothetical protein [Victivallales bacterium]
MKRRIKCPNCQTEFDVTTDLMNRNLRCNCGIKFHVLVSLPKPTLVKSDQGIKYLRTDEYLAVCDDLEHNSEKYFSLDSGRTWVSSNVIFKSLKVSCTVVPETPQASEPQLVVPTAPKPPSKTAPLGN